MRLTGTPLPVALHKIKQVKQDVGWLSAVSLVHRTLIGNGGMSGC